jgi:outer membrane cobalamin receptor
MGSSAPVGDTHAFILRVGFLVITTFGAGASALAQTSQLQPGSSGAPPSRGSVRDIEEVSLDDVLNRRVSIAAGRLQRPEEAPSIVSVITDIEIRRRGARILADILQAETGFEVLTDSQGRDRVTIRGIANSETSFLVLYNGNRLNEHLTGGTAQVNLSIPLYNIQRIEIIRGPGSALYGANAFLGVVNLVPYSPRDFEGVEVSADAGSFATQRYSAIYGRVFENSGFVASSEFVDTNGPRLLVPEDALTLRDPLVSRAPGYAPRDRRSFEATINGNVDALAVDVRYRDERGGGYVGLFGVVGPANTLHSGQFVAAATRPVVMPAGWILTPRASYTQNKVDLFVDALPPGVSVPSIPGELFFKDGLLIDTGSNSRRYEAAALMNSPAGKRVQHTVGISYEHEGTFGISTAVNYDLLTRTPRPTLQPAGFLHITPTARSIFGLFAQEQVNLAAIGVTAGVRYDRYSDFGDTLNPRVGLVWRLPSNLHLQALYGEAFRAPSFQEMVYSVPGFVSGNPDLRPAKAQTGELAFSYVGGRWRVSADYFRTSADDLILSTEPIGESPPPQQTTSFANTPGLNSHGVELDVRHTFGLDRSLFANYTVQRVTEKATDLRAADAPAHVANAGVTVGVSRYATVSPTLFARGKRPRAWGDPRSPASGYALMNVNVRLKNFFNTLEIAVTVDNVFDTKYSHPAPAYGLPQDYPTPGRALFARAHYRF